LRREPHIRRAYLGMEPDSPSPATDP
jgi:hypothetical protein